MENEMREGYISVEDAVKVFEKEKVHTDKSQLGQYIKKKLLKTRIIKGIEPPYNKAGWQVNVESLNGYIEAQKGNVEHLKLRIEELALENQELRKRSDRNWTWYTQEEAKVKELELKVEALKQRIHELENPQTEENPLTDEKPPQKEKPPRKPRQKRKKKDEPATKEQTAEQPQPVEANQGQPADQAEEQRQPAEQKA